MTRVLFVAGLMLVLTAAMPMPARAGVQTVPGQTGSAPGTAAHAHLLPRHHAAAPHSAEPAAPSASQIQALRAHRPIDKNRRAKLDAHLAKLKAARAAGQKPGAGFAGASQKNAQAPAAGAIP
jgi:hypothetical protein